MTSTSQPATASMSVTNLDAKLIKFETSLPFDKVVQRLEKEVNKEGSAGALDKLRAAAGKDRDEIEKVINSITELKNDFLFFLKIQHHPWLNTYYQTDTMQPTVCYTIGNPLIAQTILRHDIRAGLHVPLRLLIQEKHDKEGALVMYQLPSSIMVIPGDVQEAENGELKKAVGALDRKLEALIKRVVGMEDVGKEDVKL